MDHGLPTTERVATLPKQEALHLIFRAGFSTASEVTSVSGRGVGLDVVRSNVERVGGSVELESVVGLGTTLRLNMPLTMAIVPALVVRSGGQSFALPQRTLLELVYVKEREIATSIQRIGSAEVYRRREQLLPLLRLDALLGLNGGEERGSNGLKIAIVETDGCRYGLAVDELVAPQELVVKPLSVALRPIGFFAGATVLGNGTLALILDVAGIAAKAGLGAKGRLSGGEAPVDPNDAGQPVCEECSMVVYELVRETRWGRQAERCSIPLAAVERIETMDRGRIEFAGGQPMVRYCGELLAVEDESGVLHRSEPAELTFLICTRADGEGGRRIAAIVERVLDICTSETAAGKDRSTTRQVAAVLDDKVALVHEPSLGVA
ncbi:MAG: hypothetical protein NVSMB62_12580 [Acidobacteriaceae bacterium]